MYSIIVLIIIEGEIMGTTLASIHVYTDKEQDIRNIVSDTYQVKSISSNWVSIFGDTEFIFKANGLVNKLKKEVDKPILLFSYHDDDMMGLALYSNKERRASYHISFGYTPIIQKTKNFVQDFGWDENLLSRLRKIFKCEDMSKTLSMIEEFFGVALFICSDFIADGIDDFVQKQDDKIYTEYINELKKQSKIKNKTKITLIDEMEALPMFKFRKFRGNRIEVAEKISDKVYDTENTTIYHLVNGKLELFCKMGEIERATFGCDLKRDLFIRYTTVGKITIYSEDLKKKHTILLSERIVNVVEFLDNDDMLFTSRDDSGSYVERADINGDLIWTFKAENTDISDCILVNEEIYLLTNFFNGSDKGFVLYKLSIEGELKEKRKLEGVLGDRLYKVNNRIFIFFRDYTSGKCIQRLQQINNKLEKITEIEFKEKERVFSVFMEYEENTVLDITMTNRIMKINLDTGEKDIGDIKGELSIEHIDKRGNIFVSKWMSTVFILDSDLKTISKHRVKGFVDNFIEDNDKLYMITKSGEEDWIDPEQRKERMVRVYEIEYI